jgi:hypothetical protein
MFPVAQGDRRADLGRRSAKREGGGAEGPKDRGAEVPPEWRRRWLAEAVERADAPRSWKASAAIQRGEYGSM